MLPENIINRICRRSSSSIKNRNFYSDRTKETKETKQLKSPESQLMQANLMALTPEPSSYLYMNAEEFRGNPATSNKTLFDAKPPGTHHESGAIKREPSRTGMGRWKAVGLVLALIYMGGQLSSLGAHMLHEYEIFELPDENDDD